MAGNSDYKRSFIIMRPMDGGSPAKSGFCKMEQRAGRARLTFTVQGFLPHEEDLYALLVKRTPEGIVECGSLQVDGNGMGTLQFDFNPSALDGQPYKAYQGVCICKAGNGITYPLIASINGGGAIDWRGGVEQLLLARFLPSKAESTNKYPGHEASPSLSGPEKDPSFTLDSPAPHSPSSGDKVADSLEAVSQESTGLSPQDLASEKWIPTNIPSWNKKDRKPSTGTLRAASAPTEADDTGVAEEELTDTSDTDADATQTPALKSDALPLEDQPDSPGSPETEASEAGDTPSDGEIEWLGTAAAIRHLFQESASIAAPYSAKNFQFARVTLPNGLPISHYLVGAEVDAQRVVSLCYGIPGSQGEEAPAGLEGYQFRPYGQGSGYWMIWCDAQSGDAMPPKW